MNFPMKFSALLFGFAVSVAGLPDLAGLLVLGFLEVFFAPVTDGGSLKVGALNVFILRLTSAESLPFLTGSSRKMESNEAI